MLTIKAEVQQGKQRSDGTYNVKVRFTFDGNSKLVLDWGDNDPETYKVAIADNKMNLTYEDGHSESYNKQ